MSRTADKKPRVKRSSGSRRPVAILLVVFMVLTLVVGCSGNGELANEPVLPTQEPTSTPLLSTQEPAANGPVLPIYQPATSLGFATAMGGELVVEGPCLYIVDAFGDRWLPIFKAGSVSWEEDALIYHGERFELGEIAVVGGGEITSTRTLQFLQEPDESCDLQHIWLGDGRVVRDSP